MSLDVIAVELAVIHELLDEIGLGQRRPADADERNPAVAHIRRPGVHEILLQVTIAAADHGDLRRRALQRWPKRVWGRGTGSSWRSRAVWTPWSC